jgi:hypothetical protein
LAFFSVAALFGTAAHLISELAGLGWHDDAALVLSARHGYLAFSSLAALAGLLVALLILPRGDGRMRVAALIRALPFGGSGAGFAATAFLAQFGFCTLTQIGEGSPLSSGDVVTGLVAGGLAAALGALVVTLGKRRVLEFALALVWATLPVAFGCGVVGGVAADRALLAPATRRTPFAFRYRPPPVAA